MIDNQFFKHGNDRLDVLIQHTFNTLLKKKSTPDRWVPFHLSPVPGFFVQGGSQWQVAQIKIRPQKSNGLSIPFH